MTLSRISIPCDVCQVQDPLTGRWMATATVEAEDGTWLLSGGSTSARAQASLARDILDRAMEDVRRDRRDGRLAIHVRSNVDDVPLLLLVEYRYSWGYSIHRPGADRPTWCFGMASAVEALQAARSHATQLGEVLGECGFVADDADDADDADEEEDAGCRCDRPSVAPVPDDDSCGACGGLVR